MKKLWEEMKKVVKILFSLFMENDSKLSMTRVSIAVVLGAYIHWVNQIIKASENIKDIPDIPYAVAALLAALYNFNKGGTISLGRKDGTQG